MKRPPMADFKKLKYFFYNPCKSV